MKKNSTSQSGFFNQRVLIASVLCSIGLFLALVGFGAMDMGVLSFGGTDINLITGTETSPHITQNGSSAWGHGSTVIVAYQDSSGDTLSPQSYCGVSTSTDGGSTFTRLPEKFNTGGACYGYPSVFYSVRAAKWYVSFLAGRCGGFGVGQWTSLDGINWSNGSCASSSSQDDLLSIWVDNNPASPFYGRQYAFFNDYNVGGGVPHQRIPPRQHQHASFRADRRQRHDRWIYRCDSSHESNYSSNRSIADPVRRA
jgi:hypothetical protein